MPVVIVWDADLCSAQKAQDEARENAQIHTNTGDLEKADLWNRLASALNAAEEVVTPSITDWMKAKVAARDDWRYEVRQDAKPFEDLAAEFAKTQNKPLVELPGSATYTFRTGLPETPQERARHLAVAALRKEITAIEALINDLQAVDEEG